MKVELTESGIDRIQDYNNIGILWSNGEKSFLSIDANRCVRASNRGVFDFIGTWYAASKRDYCKTVLEARQGDKIYFFDSLEEMMIWYFNKNAV